MGSSAKVKSVCVCWTLLLGYTVFHSINDSP